MDNEHQSYIRVCGILKECVNLILQLPKPVIFNTFSLQHFPDYPMTHLALEAGHITEEELEDWPTMMRRTTENWKFIPRWKKEKKQEQNNFKD